METGPRYEILKKLLEDLRSSDLKIGLKYKKLNEFVKEARSLNFGEIINLVNPADFFSRRLCIDIACALKNLDYIVHLLKTAESAVLRAALKKNAWLYRKDSVLTDPDVLLNELFPLISFTCRQIILTNLPHHLNDEERCASIFEAVGTKYGFENTGDLIVGCSSAYILKVLKTKQLTLANRHLKSLLVKFPQLVEEYLIEFYKTRHTKNYSTYSNVLQLIAYSHPAILMGVLEVGSWDWHWLTLKPKEANRILRFGKEKILANPAKYVQHIDIAGAYKQLARDEFMLLFASLWPDTIITYHGLGTLLSYKLNSISCNREKGEIIQKTYLTKYGVSMLSNEKLCSSEVVKPLLLPDIRTKIVEAEILKFQPREYSFGPDYDAFTLANIIAFKSIDKSIPEIKKICEDPKYVGTPYRSHIFACLISTCAINEDKNALVEVCKYYVNIHNNEGLKMHDKILEEIVKKFNLAEFNSEIWSAIFEIIQLELQSDNKYNNYNLNAFIEHLYIFQTLHPKDAATFKCSEMLINLLKRKISEHGWYCWGWEINVIRKMKLSVKEFVKIVMKEMEIVYPKQICKLGTPEFEFVPSLLNGILSCLFDWNRKMCRKSQLISVMEFPWMAETVNEILEDRENYCYYHNALIYHLKRDPILKKDETALRKFMNLCPSSSFFIGFLRRNPKVLAEDWETVEFSLYTSISESLNCLELIKYHGYTELSTKLVRKSELVLQEATEFGEADLRPRAVTLLSVFLDSSKFLETVQLYIPQTMKVDIGRTDEADGMNMLVRSSIVSALKNLEFPSDGLTTLLKFCSGDYLKFSLGALYSLSYKAGYGQVLNLLIKLIKRPVSVKKHAIRLICRMSTQQDVHELLRSLSGSEGNESIRLILLNQLFAKPAVSWQALKSLISKFDVKEVNSLVEVTNQDNIDKIPAHNLEEYFTIVWKLFDTFDTQGQELYKPKLVSNIQENMEKLPSEFINAFLRSHLSLELSNSFQNSICTLFVQHILDTGSTNLIENLQILQTGLQGLYSPDLNTLKIQNEISGIARHKSFLSDLIYALTSALQSEANKNHDEINYRKQLLEGLLNLPALQKPYSFDERLAIKFLSIFQIQTPEVAPDHYFEVGKELMTLLDTQIANHGREIFPIFKDILVSSVPWSWRNRHVDLVDLVTGIVESKAINWTEKTAIALELLPSDPKLVRYPESQVKFKTTLDNIFNSTEPLIQVQAYNWINNIYIYSENRNDCFQFTFE